MINSHHLDLFYYVAKYRGISAASRNMPYGIGQPAISGQIADLERHLGKTLFVRKPFRLTAAGRRLYDHIKDMFDGLPRLEADLQGGPGLVGRIAVDDLIGSAFLPAFLAATASGSRDTVWEFLSIPHEELENRLREHHVSVAITTTVRPLRGIHSCVLAQLRPCLIVPRKAKILAPVHFWRQTTIAEPLICSLGSPALRQSFERGLQGLHATWPATIMVGSFATMMTLITQGHGVGLGLALPSLTRHPSVRTLPLPGFDPVSIVALWCGTAPAWCAPLLTAVRSAECRGVA